MNKNIDEQNLTEYRISKLEDAVAQLVSSFTILQEICVRWDAKINDSGWPTKCVLHDERIINLNKKLDEQNEKINIMHKDIDAMKSIIWKASGALVIISIVVQLLGPMIVEKAFGNHKPSIEFIEK